MKRLTALLLCLLMLAGCGRNQPAKETEPPQTEAVPESAAMTEAAAPQGSQLLERAPQGTICIGLIPTEIGAWRYVVLPDQEAAAAAMEKAFATVDYNQGWVKGDRSLGLMASGNGDYWNLTAGGSMVLTTGRVEAEAAADFYAMCLETARETGWQEPVEAEALTDLRSASLNWNGADTALTDPEALARLGVILSGGQRQYSTTSCPFGAVLTLETGSGETVTIALATDSCGVWMSEGVYYDFGSDSQEVFALFCVTLG